MNEGTQFMKKTAIAAATAATLLGLTSATYAQCGGASWYALNSRTASGEWMNPAAMTAAHKTLPLGSKVRVTHAKTGKSIVVRINDRGPFVKGRMIDLSKGAARKLGFIGAGHAKVCIKRV
jgi:rare lipoprotein A